MKILHTSDWHIGQELYKYDRSEEHKVFFSHLCGIVKDERPDVLLVCGDVFHQSNPSIAAKELYTEALLDIHEVCPEMQIIVTAGNHDSSSRLEIERKLWNCFRVTVVGNVEKVEDEYNLEKFIQQIKDVDGNLKGYVIAVPFIHPNNFPVLTEEKNAIERQLEFFVTLQNMVAERNPENLPVVMTAHLAVSAKEDNANIIAGMDYSSMSDFGEYYDYLALGHIHKPYTIKGERARYCGSPFRTSFDDTSEHSVTIVEINRHGDMPEIKTVSIEPLRQLVHKEFDSIEDCQAYVDTINPEIKQYMLLDIKFKDVAIDQFARDRFIDRLKDTGTRFCDLRWIHVVEKVDSVPVFTSVEIKENNPVMVAKQFIRDTCGQELDLYMEDLLKELVEEFYQNQK